MARIQQQGIEPTYVMARSRYEKLAAPHDPVESGERQALEMFFTMLGMSGEQPLQIMPEPLATS
jgi:hypothetical protein